MPVNSLPTRFVVVGLKFFGGLSSFAWRGSSCWWARLGSWDACQRARTSRVGMAPSRAPLLVHSRARCSRDGRTVRWLLLVTLLSGAASSPLSCFDGHLLRSQQLGHLLPTARPRGVLHRSHAAPRDRGDARSRRSGSTRRRRAAHMRHGCGRGGPDIRGAAPGRNAGEPPGRIAARSSTPVYYAGSHFQGHDLDHPVIFPQGDYSGSETDRKSTPKMSSTWSTAPPVAIARTRSDPNGWGSPTSPSSTVRLNVGPRRTLLVREGGRPAPGTPSPATRPCAWKRSTTRRWWIWSTPCAPQGSGRGAEHGPSPAVSGNSPNPPAQLPVVRRPTHPSSGRERPSSPLTQATTSCCAPSRRSVS